VKLQQLETFFWVVSLGSFAAAAERMHTTQSTISVRIRELEKGLGVELFDRTQRAARLTPKGHELLEYASRLLELTAEIEHKIAATESVTGSVRLGVAEVVSTTWLPRLIKFISRTYPLVRLEIDQALTEDLMEALKGGAVDLVLAPGRVPTPSLNATSLGTVQFAWLASPALQLGGKLQTAAALAQWPVIGLTPKSFHYAGVENWFQRGNARFRYLARCKSMAVAASMVVAELGIAYLPIRCYQEQIDRRQLEVLQTPPLPPVEFIAATAADGFHPLAGKIMQLAEENSDFERIRVPSPA
jgi:DNA-binding transcriptional LysR family regulator